MGHTSSPLLLSLLDTSLHPPCRHEVKESEVEWIHHTHKTPSERGLWAWFFLFSFLAGLAGSAFRLWRVKGKKFIPGISHTGEIQKSDSLRTLHMFTSCFPGRCPFGALAACELTMPMLCSQGDECRQIPTRQMPRNPSSKSCPCQTVSGICMYFLPVISPSPASIGGNVESFIGGRGMRYEALTAQQS